MSSFSVEQLEKKVKILTMSQQSIQTLSLWCIHHRRHSKKIVHNWHKTIQKARPEKRLALIYLANDILQNSRRKGAEFSKEFGSILPSAFTHCLNTKDAKVKEAITRVLNIWHERSVYDKKFLSSLQSVIRKHGGQSDDDEEEEERSTTPPLDTMPIDEADFTTTATPNTPTINTPSASTITEDTEEEIKAPDNPPDPDDLVRRLQDLENSATQDAVVREKIANLPTEVTDPTYIDKIDNLESGRVLQAKINAACALLDEYNKRLSTEQTDRAIAHKMLIDYTTNQKYHFHITEKKIEEYDRKLKKVTSVKKELQSHLENLPDLSKLPSPVPLPSAGDLFATSRK